MINMHIGVHLFPDVVVLRVELAVLPALRAVDRCVQRSFHDFKDGNSKANRFLSDSGIKVCILDLIDSHYLSHNFSILSRASGNLDRNPLLSPDTKILTERTSSSGRSVGTSYS